MLSCHIHVPNEHLGSILKLCQERRGTQKGIEYGRIVTIGSPPDGAISGFATQMMTDGALIGAADSVGISF